jgi:hypothetical protein
MRAPRIKISDRSTVLFGKTERKNQGIPDSFQDSQLTNLKKRY